MIETGSSHCSLSSFSVILMSINSASVAIWRGYYSGCKRHTGTVVMVSMAYLRVLTAVPHTSCPSGVSAAGGKKIFLTRLVPSGRLPSSGALMNCTGVRNEGLSERQIIQGVRGHTL